MHRLSIGVNFEWRCSVINGATPFSLFTGSLHYICNHPLKACHIRLHFVFLLLWCCQLPKDKKKKENPLIIDFHICICPKHIVMHWIQIRFLLFKQYLAFCQCIHLIFHFSSSIRSCVILQQFILFCLCFNC